MRLIDADELLQKRWQAKDITDKDLYVIGQGFVMSAPTIDAAPVVHARWVNKGWYKECSKCFNHIGFLNQYVPRYDYCPFCGAKMEEE